MAGGELVFGGVFRVSQQEDVVFAFGGLEFHFDVVGGYRTPAVGDAVAGDAPRHVLRVAEVVVKSDKGFAVCVESLNGRVHAVEGVVVAAFFILRFVIDDGSVHFHFAGRKVALEVFHVGGGVPQAPFGEGEEFEPLHFAGEVFQRQFLYLAPRVQRHEEQYAGFDAVLGTGDAGVAHAVAALVEVRRRFARFPSGRPYRSAVVDVKVSSAAVHRHVVVAVAGDAAELGVLVESVSAGGVRDE